MGMADQATGTVTRLLREVENGNHAVMNELFSFTYEALKELAHQQRRGWHGDNTLNTTALVHDAYEKLVDQTQASWKSRGHFFGVAAKAMRRILIDYARSRRAEKRGGNVQKISLEEMQAAMSDRLASLDEKSELLLVLDEGLERLAKVNELQSRIIECRFFAGLTLEDTATALDVSTATVTRHWNMARAWLFRELQRDLVEPNGP